MYARLHSTLLRAVLPILLAAGCDGCPSDKPYTPFTLGSALPAGSAPPLSGTSADPQAQPDASLRDAPDAGDAAPAFVAAASVPAPGDGKRWPLDAGTVNAPPGRAFETGLLLDADGDGARDLVAWARAPDGLRGELWFAPGSKPDAARTLAALPGDLSAQGCAPRVALKQLGPTTLVFDFDPDCSARARSQGPVAARWIAVFRLQDAPTLVQELRLRAPPPDELLTVALDAADRDGDGRGDLGVTLGLAGALRAFPTAPGAEPRVPLVFLDRPAGLSRDPSQPGAGLRELVDRLLREARSKAGAKNVAASAWRLRRLYTAMCADAAGEPASRARDAELAGAALVTTGAGPVLCNQPDLAAQIDHAEAVAAQTAGAPLAALAALDRGARRTKDAEKLRGKLAPEVTATAVHRMSAAPHAGPATGWSPLAFEASGDLLVRTARGVIRVDRATFAESPADVPAWPEAVTAGRAELVAVERRCDAPTLLALVRSSPEAVGEMEVPLPLLRGEGPRSAPRSGAAERCSGAERLGVTPLGASEGGIDLAVGGALLTIDLRAAAPSAAPAKLPLASPALPGAARSPDGATIVAPLADGLLVATSGGGARRWAGADLAGATSCVPTNGGARVACIAAGAATIYEGERPK